ncbi:MAG: hypothetical protein NTV29_08720 [Planctomycetota bacterium]|nr:hypothetical protein [Planctomycetota bacterium]
MVKLSIRNLFDVHSRRIEALDFQQDLFIHHTLGLGDMIHFNGLVRYLLCDLSANRKIRVFCKTRNVPMAQWMYRDEPRVVLEAIDPDKREGQAVQRILRRNRTKNFLCLGHRAMRPLLKKYPHTFFDQLFYLQAEVPYSIRYSHCYWARDYQQEERVYKKLITERNLSQGGYAFVHDDPERGYRVDTDRIELPIVGNDITESIFHLGLVLERAAQVHCMESSIRCMIESLQMQKVELYYHNFRYPDRPLGTATELDWEQIEYSSDHSRRS